jgi:hypothetical protein
MGTQINHADSSISSYIIFFMSHLYEYHEFKNVYFIFICNLMLFYQNRFTLKNSFYLSFDIFSHLENQKKKEELKLILSSSKQVFFSTHFQVFFILAGERYPYPCSPRWNRWLSLKIILFHTD